MGQPHQIEVVTKALEAFLVQSGPRRLEGEEALARLRALFDSSKPPMPTEEDGPNRILVMWRLARATAKLAGICAEDEPLDAATEITPDPWTHSLKMRLTPSQQAVLRRASAAELIALFANGMPLLPPSDPAVAPKWCEAMSLLARDLNIGRTPEGLAGLNGLLHPNTCSYAGVNEVHILAIEELLVDEAQKLIIECGERPAIEHFREKYGFSRKEAIGLMRLARSDALTTGGSSTEEDRAIMIAQLKDLIARAKEEMNSDKELKALKQLAAIQGLTRTEPEDIARDFMRVIGSVAQRQDRILEAKEALQRLPSAEPTMAEYTVLPRAASAEPEDAEALAEYDKEN